ncbi:MAG TPA: hypothetical protein DGZ24_06150, partial [Rhodospirillaceae bacterium]|nr:hypothetical protein [Rhodospirillaceae bacterium]
MHALIKKCFFLGRTNIWPAIRFGAISFLTASVIAGCSAPLLQDEVLQSSVDEPANDGSSARMRLITSEQYLNTLAHTFGPSIDLGSKFPPLQRTKGLLANGAATAGVTAAQLEQYQRTAASVASQVVDNEHRNFLISCKPENEKAADQECAAEFLAEAGRLLYRRPLSEIQIKEAAEKASIAGNDLEDFYTGLAIALEGMLISPEMLFIVETVEP